MLCQLLFTSISRSLFNEDRAVFGMHFMRSIRKDLFPQEAWEFFVGSSPPLLLKSDQRKASPSWIPHEISSVYHALILALPEVASSNLFEDTVTWRSWMTSGSVNLDLPETESSSMVGPFQKLVVINALRPDRS